MFFRSFSPSSASLSWSCAQPWWSSTASSSTRKSSTLSKTKNWLSEREETKTTAIATPAILSSNLFCEILRTKSWRLECTSVSAAACSAWSSSPSSPWWPELSFSCLSTKTSNVRSQIILQECISEIILMPVTEPRRSFTYCQSSGYLKLILD